MSSSRPATPGWNDARNDRRKALEDLILGKHNPWATLYEPSRITLRATKDFAKENLTSRPNMPTSDRR